MLSPKRSTRDTQQTTQRALVALAADRQAVLAEFAKIAFSNILDYVRIDPAGHAEVDLTRLDRDKGAAIDEVIVDYSNPRNGDPPQVKRVRFKLADKRAALVDLGRHLGLFSDRRQSEEDFSGESDEELRERIRVLFSELTAAGVDVRSLFPGDGPVEGSGPTGRPD